METDLIIRNSKYYVISTI